MKTKKIKVRQGFTIVELVIVIGVIGVLAGVLIPTFINLNNKANEASNQAFVKNLNTQMAIREQEEGKNATYAMFGRKGYEAKKAELDSAKAKAEKYII